MALFTFSKQSTKPELDAKSTAQPVDTIICKSPEKLQALVNKIKEGKDVHYISDGDWSMHDLLAAVLPDCAPAAIYLSTYALRELPVRQLIMSMDRGDLTSLNMLVDYRAQIRVPAVFQLASINATKIRLTAIHAKVMVLKGEDKSISIVGSANWTSNPRVEAGVVSLDPDIANFHIGWMTKLLDNAQIFE